jgi:hypothetical protein
MLNRGVRKKLCYFTGGTKFFKSKKTFRLAVTTKGQAYLGKLQKTFCDVVVQKCDYLKKEI